MASSGLGSCDCAAVARLCKPASGPRAAVERPTLRAGRRCPTRAVWAVRAVAGMGLPHFLLTRRPRYAQSGACHRAQPPTGRERGNAMARTPYDTDLDRNPDHTAIIHGSLKRSYAEFYRRARRLGSALVRRGIKPGDTVTAMLANTPAMLEAHYGVPMAGAVLNTLNTRL